MTKVFYEEENENFTHRHCGNHAGFGSYGTQEVDGAAMISSAEQVEITVDAITQLIGRN